MRHKFADLIHKWAEGAAIQVKDSRGTWTTVTPEWNAYKEYRVAPEKSKRTGWVHVCRYDDHIRYIGSTIYHSKEVALQNTPTNCIEIIKIEWEE